MLAAIEGILAVFVFGTWMFWVGLVALSLVLLFFLEYQEDGFRSTLIFVLLLAYLQFAAKLPFFHFVGSHPFLTIGGYLLGGIVYGFFRWAWHCSKFRGRYKEVKAVFAEKHGLQPNFNPTDLSPDVQWGEDDDRRFGRGRVQQEGLQTKWKQALESGKASQLPVARTSKALITLWMTYWPWSLLWTLVQDFVVKLWEHIYTFLSKAFQQIADRVLGTEIQKDFAS